VTVPGRSLHLVVTVKGLSQGVTVSLTAESTSHRSVYTIRLLMLVQLMHQQLTYAYIVWYWALYVQIVCERYSITYKKLSYRRGTARRAVLVNSCYVSLGIGIRTVTNSESDLQGHSRQWCHSIEHTRFPISLPLQLCLYLAPCPKYYHLFPKIEKVHVTPNTSLLWVIYHACTLRPSHVY